MQKTFTYSLKDKLMFYASYFFYKVIIPFEVRKPRWRLWLYEWKYTIEKFKEYNVSIAWPYTIDTISTKFGIFKIRLNTSDAANVSPAFERRDVNYLLKLLKTLRKKNRKVLFCDIGADLGGYSVIVGNRFQNKGVTVKTFEPVQESCTLIQENVRMNHLDTSVELFPVALSNENNPAVTITLNIATPGSSSMVNAGSANVKECVIETKKLDDVIKDMVTDYDVLVLKIDVEGMEQQVLEGAHRVIKSGKEVFVMIEDFIDPAIITYMQNAGWHFLKKVTSYNSWWRYGEIDKR
jgi:FkbM family methyltransferase